MPARLASHFPEHIWRVLLRYDGFLGRPAVVFLVEKRSSYFLHQTGELPDIIEINPECMTPLAG